MVAEVRPQNQTTGEESPNVHVAVATTGAAAVNSSSATLPAPPRSSRWVPLGWIGGPLIVVVLLAASWALVHYRGLSKSAEQTSIVVSPIIGSLAVLPLAQRYALF